MTGTHEEELSPTILHPLGKLARMTSPWFRFDVSTAFPSNVAGTVVAASQVAVGEAPQAAALVRQLP